MQLFICCTFAVTSTKKYMYMYMHAHSTNMHRCSQMNTTNTPPFPHHCVIHSSQVLVVDGHHIVLLPCTHTQPDGLFIALCSFLKLLFLV